MARVKYKFQLADGVSRVVSINPDATVGARIGTDLYMPNGTVATAASLADYIGTLATSESATAHRLLAGLNLGDDHPQYTRKDTLTTRGDLYVRGASTVGRLALGSANQFLQVGATDPAWQTISPIITLGTDLSGNVTLTNLTNGTLNAAIVANSVTDTKLRDSAALSVIGRASNTSGDPADIASSGGTDVLRRSGTAIGFGAIDHTYVSDFDEAAQDAVGGMFVDSSEINFTYDDSGATVTADLISASVAFAKLQNIATSRILGRISASTGSIESLTGTQATTLLDTFTSALKGLVPLSGGGTTNFLRADGTWVAPSSGAPGGSTTQVQYNNAGAFGGSAGFTWVDGTSTLGIGTTAAPGVIKGIGGTTTGNPITLKGGAAVGATSAGGVLNLVGGDGGATSGSGGAVTVVGGTGTDGNGGAVTLTGGAGVGTNRNGGNVTITSGTATGSGTDGVITLAGGRVRAVDGTVALPAYSFTSDPDTGLYWISANRVGVAVGGVLMVDVSAGALTSTYSQNGNTALTVGNPNSGGSARASLALGNGTDSIAMNMFGVNNAVSNVVTGGPATTGAAFGTGGATPFTIYTNSTERIRIDANGVNIWAKVPLRLPNYTVGGLPSAATTLAGSMAYVSDANATTRLAAVAGGGSNKLVVFSDGTNWLIL